MSLFTRFRHRPPQERSAPGHDLTTRVRPRHTPGDDAAGQGGAGQEEPDAATDAQNAAGRSTAGDETARDETARDETARDDTAGDGGGLREDAAAVPEGGAGGADPPGGRPRGGTRIAARLLTPLAALLVLGALLLPNRIGSLAPGAFLRIPVEGLLLVAVLLALRPWPRRVVAALAGVGLGLLTIVKILDMGFYSVLVRPFDLVLDWVLFDDAVGFLTESVGRAGAIGGVVAAVVLVVVLLVLMALAVVRLTHLVVRHHTATTRSVAVLAVAWITCAALGVQIFPGVPVAAKNTATLAHNRAHQVSAGLRDQTKFAAEAAVDDFRHTPGDELLTALRGKDVILAFVESYGRDAVEDPEFAAQVGAVLDAGTRRLSTAGYSSRSAFLSSPTVGGGSWLAHATFNSGLWINNEARYRNLISSDRLTLPSAFRRANWQTVGVMPGVTRTWPEGNFYGYQRLHDSRNLGYQGPKFSWAPVPDQYTLSAFERLEHAKPRHAPMMAEIPLVSSHAPWVPIPRLIDWADVGDGSVYDAMAGEGDPKDVVWSDKARVRIEYRRSIEYTLNTLISYVERYGDENLVLVFLGDHQPSPIITGEGASRDVPITIVAHDQAVLDRTAGWGWQDGLKPGPRAPVWRMDTFRDRFLTTFGDRSEATRPSSAPPR